MHYFFISFHVLFLSHLMYYFFAVLQSKRQSSACKKQKCKKLQADACCKKRTSKYPPTKLALQFSVLALRSWHSNYCYIIYNRLLWSYGKAEPFEWQRAQREEKEDNFSCNAGRSINRVRNTRQWTWMDLRCCWLIDHEETAIFTEVNIFNMIKFFKKFLGRA